MQEELSLLVFLMGWRELATDTLIVVVTRPHTSYHLIDCLVAQRFCCHGNDELLNGTGK